MIHFLIFQMEDGKAVQRSVLQVPMDLFVDWLSVRIWCEGDFGISSLRNIPPHLEHLFYFSGFLQSRYFLEAESNFIPFLCKILDLACHLEKKQNSMSKIFNFTF